MRELTVELLWWQGCPSTERALAELRAALADVGLERVQVRMREIESDEDAVRTGFAGSPTILLDGADIFPEAGEEPAGLNCRVYRRRDGRLSPTPDPDDLRAALRLAARHQEVS